MAIFKIGQEYKDPYLGNKNYITFDRDRSTLSVKSEYYDYDGIATDFLEFKILKDGDREYFLCNDNNPNSRIYAEEFNGVSVDYCALMYKGKEVGQRLDIYLTRSKKPIFLGDVLSCNDVCLEDFDGLRKDPKRDGTTPSVIKLEGFLDKETGTILFGRDSEYKEIPSLEVLQRLIREAANKL